MKLQDLSDLVNSCIDFFTNEYGKTINLDIEKTILYGTRSYVNGYIVDSIVKGIEAGDSFPPIFVSKNSDGSYNIGLLCDKLDTSNYGGHHRAIAHMRAKKNLKCLLQKKSQDRKTQIKDISIVRTPEAYASYIRKKENNKRYR